MGVRGFFGGGGGVEHVSTAADGRRRCRAVRGQVGVVDSPHARGRAAKVAVLQAQLLEHDLAVLGHGCCVKEEEEEGRVESAAMRGSLSSIDPPDRLRPSLRVERTSGPASQWYSQRERATARACGSLRRGLRKEQRKRTGHKGGGGKGGGVVRPPRVFACACAHAADQVDGVLYGVRPCELRE